jgi:hypothetical protein
VHALVSEETKQEQKHIYLKSTSTGVDSNGQPRCNLAVEEGNHQNAGKILSDMIIGTVYKWQYKVLVIDNRNKKNARKHFFYPKFVKELKVLFNSDLTFNSSYLNN